MSHEWAPLTGPLQEVAAALSGYPSTQRLDLCSPKLQIISRARALFLIDRFTAGEATRL